MLKYFCHGTVSVLFMCVVPYLLVKECLFAYELRDFMLAPSIALFERNIAGLTDGTLPAAPSALAFFRRALLHVQPPA